MVVINFSLLIYMLLFNIYINVELIDNFDIYIEKYKSYKDQKSSILLLFSNINLLRYKYLLNNYYIKYFKNIYFRIK